MVSWLLPLNRQPRIRTAGHTKAPESLHDVGTALRAMIVDSLPKPEEVEEARPFDKEEKDGLMWRRFFLSRKGTGEQIPAVGIRGKHALGSERIDQDGKG